MNALSLIDIDLSDISFISNFQKLKELYLSNNAISNIAPLTNSINIEKLDLSYNLIEDISSLQNLQHLNKLKLSNNKISRISSIKNSLNIEELDLSNNSIEDISDLINFQHLKKLALSNNIISNISPLINSVNIEELDFSNNLIEDISALQNFKHFKKLVLSNNKISDISPLKNSVNIEEIDLSVNSIEDISALSNFKNLKKLALTSNKISELTPLRNSVNIEKLNLSANSIEDISALSNFQNLKKLELSNNKISELSPLRNYVNVEELDLSANSIEDISALSNFKQLKNLDLSNNFICDITPLKNYITLKELNLNSNQISGISQLKNVYYNSIIRIENNLVEYIPKSFFDSYYTNIDNRNIDFVRELKNYFVKQQNYEFAADARDYESTLQKGESLTESQINSLGYNYFRLVYNNNSKLNPPLELIKQGRNSLNEWYKSNKQNLNEIKIILIGEPKSGKTSLLRKLKFDSFNENEVQTDGINIEDIEFGLYPSFRKQALLHKIIGHFWDFGGQEIMNATHQFFLTKRSVYILVLDARKDANTSTHIRRWVKRIIATGGNSSIIVVANQIDINSGFGFENMYELENEFPQIKYFIKASCKTGENIDFIKDKLEELIPLAEFFNTSIDEKWISIKEELQIETKENYFLNESRFLEICNKFKLHEKSQQKSAITFLHDLGLVLHFDNIKSYEYFVLDPYWITYGVYQILTSRFVGKKNGIINFDKLEFIVNEEEDKKESYQVVNFKKIQYANNQRRFLVEILHQFKLCFYLPDRSHFIIPDLLTTNEPTEITEPLRKSQDCVRFVYEYDYLPKSTMPRILVETHSLHLKIWRTGCLLIYDGCHALITNYQNKISIIVTGEHKKKREFMAVIRAQTNKINENLNDKPQMLIPLPKFDVYVDYEELLEREKDGEKYYTIYKPTKNKFQISELLEGIPSNDEVREINEKIDKVLTTQESLMCDQLIIIESLEQIKNKLEIHFQYLINLPDNEKIKDEIVTTVKQLDKEQSQAISDDLLKCIANAFELHQGDMDEMLNVIFNDLKKSDDIEMKLKLSISLINLLGIDLETKFDIKKWATKMYKKYELKIFKLL